MPSLVIAESATLLGYSWPSNVTVTADGSIIKDMTIAAAKTGTLSTRTDDNTGTLTMEASHGITTGARLDLYWSGGSRRGITVGTVSGTSVPIDLGAGDNLPAQATAVTAMVPTEEAFVVTGSNVSAIVLYSTIEGQFVFTQSNDTESMAKTVGASSGGQQTYFWTSARDPVNPLDSEAVTKLYFSHGSSAASATMRAAVLYT